MASLSEAKTLGGVGSILVLLAVVPGAGPLLGIVGFILILVAIKYVSDALADKSIFDNMLVGIVLAIAGVVVGTVVIVVNLINFFGVSYTNLSSIGTKINSMTFTSSNWVGLATSLFLGLAVVWVMLAVSAVFVRRSYTTIGTKLNVKMFGTAGMLYLIGAATTIILVGFVLLFVAQILLVVAFFSIEERAPAAAVPPQQPAMAGS